MKIGNSEKDRVFHLSKPTKRTLSRLIFSRTAIVLILILLQIWMLVVMYGWLQTISPFTPALQLLFTASMTLYLFNSEMDSSAKLTWLMIIAIFPVPGALFLAFSKTDIGHRTIRKRLKELGGKKEARIRQKPHILAEVEHDGSGTDDLCRYINRTGCYPLFENETAAYFPSGEAKFEAMLEELEKAEKFIFMEYFIVEEGYMWGRILDILISKAKAGVEIRVMYDGTCEMGLLPNDYADKMRAHGIPCKIFNRLHPFVSTYYNYRDHRKILVIDGKTAFTGGVNLADEYINYKERFGLWKDAAIMVKGEAVASFTLMFLQMWYLDETTPVYRPYLDASLSQNASLSQKTSHKNGYIMPYSDSPLDDVRVGETVYLDILARATDYVHIMTPYLILDDELTNALVYAAERGVDVSIILPGIPDKKLAYSLAKAHYARLVRSGVNLYEFTPGFVHSKMFVSDDLRGVVGTINLDYRSLYHHFECAAYLYRTDCLKEMEEDFQETLKKCRKVTPETIRKTSIYYKITGPLMKIVAPLM